MEKGPEHFEEVRQDPVEIAVANRLASHVFGDHHPSVDPGLFAAWRDNHDPEAGVELINRYGNFAYHVARHYRNRIPSHGAAIDEQDLAQEAMISLLYKAAVKFNPDSGVSFLTYAAHWVRGHVLEHIYTMGSTVYIPEYIQLMLAKISAANRQRTEAGMPELTDEEAAALIDVPAKGHAFSSANRNVLSIALVRAARAISKPHSIEDRPQPDLDTDLGPYGVPPTGWPDGHAISLTAPLPDQPEEVVIDRITREDIRNTIDTVFAPIKPREETEQSARYANRINQRQKRQREVLQDRLGIGRETWDEETFDAIAKRMGISSERARQIYYTAQDKVETALRRRKLLDD